MRNIGRRTSGSSDGLGDARSRNHYAATTGWLLFWIVGKRQFSRYLENYFIESRFPLPGEFTRDLDDYFSDMVVNEELDCDTRKGAAYENGALNEMKISRRYSMVFQLNSASKIALKRYEKLLASFSARRQPAPAK